MIRYGEIGGGGLSGIELSKIREETTANQLGSPDSYLQSRKLEIFYCGKKLSLGGNA